MPSLKNTVLIPRWPKDDAQGTLGNDDNRTGLARDQVEHLLVILCERFGFCLPPIEQERIIGNPPLTVNDFTDAVLLGEGIDTAITDKKIVEDVRKLVASAFAEASDSGKDK